MATKISDDFMCLKINGKIRASLHAGRLAPGPRGGPGAQAPVRQFQRHRR
jgi:hypothetical protein